MMIFAIDLGKFKSVGCLYDTDSKSATYSKFDNRPGVVHDLLVEHKPDRLVIEIGTTAGWVQDIGEALEIPTQVANTNHAAWRFSVNPNKSDRNDALRLAKMSALDELPTVNLPGKKIREWRSLIGYRTRLVRERTSIKNAIRSCLDQRGERMPPAAKGWGRENLERLAAMAKPMDQCPLDQLWRGILHEELGRLEQVQERLKTIEAKLDEVARADPRVKQLRVDPRGGSAAGGDRRGDDPRPAPLPQPARSGVVRRSHPGAVPERQHRPAGPDHLPRQPDPAVVAGGGCVADASAQPALRCDLRRGDPRRQEAQEDRGGGGGEASAGDLLGDAPRQDAVEGSVVGDGRPAPGTGGAGACPAGGAGGVATQPDAGAARPWGERAAPAS